MFWFSNIKKVITNNRVLLQIVDNVYRSMHWNEISPRPTDCPKVAKFWPNKDIIGVLPPPLLNCIVNISYYFYRFVLLSRRFPITILINKSIIWRGTVPDFLSSPFSYFNGYRMGDRSAVRFLCWLWPRLKILCFNHIKWNKKNFLVRLLSSFIFWF